MGDDLQMTVRDALENFVILKKAASRGRRLFERKVLLGGLALGELEAFAGSGLAGFFALTSTWVTAEKTSGLQHGTKFGVVLNQRAGDRELDGIGLSVHAASMGGCFDVELILKTRDFERLEKRSLKSQGGQDLFERIVIDGDFSGSGSDPDAGNGLLATSGCGKSFAHGNLVMSMDLERDRLRVLSFMRVGFTCVDLELLHLGGPKLALGDHAFDGPLEDEFGTALAHFGRSFDGLTTDVTGVTCVDLVLFLAPGEAGVLGVDDDDEVTGIDVRREDGLMLPAKEAGSLHGDFSDDLVLGINDVPSTLDVSWFC
ncbi:MAG: hypothetical protein ACJAVK_003681 [Akkermansiaceae bacterium]